MLTCAIFFFLFFSKIVSIGTTLKSVMREKTTFFSKKWILLPKTRSTPLPQNLLPLCVDCGTTFHLIHKGRQQLQVWKLFGYDAKLCVSSYQINRVIVFRTTPQLGWGEKGQREIHTTKRRRNTTQKDKRGGSARGGGPELYKIPDVDCWVLDAFLELVPLQVDLDEGQVLQAVQGGDVWDLPGKLML